MAPPIAAAGQSNISLRQALPCHKSAFARARPELFRGAGFLGRARQNAAGRRGCFGAYCGAFIASDG
jgi:hypothetical protein